MRTLNQGFAIAEVVIALVLLSLLTLLIGALGTQVMNYSKSSKQTAVVLEMRTKANAITRDLASENSNWLDKMRGDVSTEGIYAACIPDSKSATLTFSCPVHEGAIIVKDPELAKRAKNLQISSVPIVDRMGEKIAGSLLAPLYLNNDGQTCSSTNASTTCPIKSTGYFLRENTDPTKNPGNVSFIIKLERNLASIASSGNTTPMKAQYLSLDVGTSWSDTTNNISSACTTGTVQMGYASNGIPICFNPLQSCSLGEVSVGTDTNGKLICKTLPSCEAGNSAIYNIANDQFVCSPESPCGNGLFFAGFAAGNQSPICLSPEVHCEVGKVQVGMSVIGGQHVAQCASIPTCSESEKLGYDGKDFTCLKNSPTVISSEPNEQSCPSGQVMYGLNANGTVKCRPESRPTRSCRTVTADSNLPGLISLAECAADEYMESGGGECEVPGSDICAGQSPGVLHMSRPYGEGWVVDCYRADWKGDACSRAFAVCCKK